MSYSNYKTEQMALHKFVESQGETDSFPKSSVSLLMEALRNYREEGPTTDLVQSWNETYGHVENVPEQIYRDQLIVDYLHKRKGMDFENAADLWSAWEDHEFELIHSC
jgi:hypothetical protein